MRSALAALIAVAIAGCATAEPIAVPADFRSEMDGLLGPGSAFTASTCSTLPVDAPTEGNHRYRAEKSLDGAPESLLADLESDALAAGWQRHEAADLALAMTGPRPGSQLAAERTGSGLEVTVQVEYRCSSPSPLFRADTPALTDAQRTRVERVHAATTGLIGAVLAEFGGPPAGWPGPALPENVPTCEDGGKAGVLVLTPATPEVTVPDIDTAQRRITAVAPEPWVVQFGAPQERDGVTAVEITATATVDGVPVEVGVNAMTFANGTAKLLSWSGRTCVPAD